MEIQTHRRLCIQPTVVAFATGIHVGRFPEESSELSVYFVKGQFLLDFVML